MDLVLDKVRDPREARKVKYTLAQLLTVMVAGMVTRARSQRDLELRTAQMAHGSGKCLGVTERIADNTFGQVIPRLGVPDLVQCLHRGVLAEHRRGNLARKAGWREGTVAVDGKNVATLHWADLCRVVGLERQQATVAAVREGLATQYPEAQLCVPQEGRPYALVRMHTVTLISATAAVCVHVRPIAGSTNEVGSMPALLKELQSVYWRHGLFTLVTTDAGNTSCEAASLLVACGKGYFGQLKSEHGEVHREAVRQLAERGGDQAEAQYVDTQNGQVVTYHLWRHDLTAAGWLHWTHARQLVRVERVAEHPQTGERSVGNRYYVTNRDPNAMSADQALELSRAHWRCEEETHWTADAVLLEDRRRLAWSRHPRGVLVVAVLRLLALSILAVTRQLSRLGYTHETPSWRRVIEHFQLLLCCSALETAAFDNV
jgi:hypothetical protein